RRGFPAPRRTPRRLEGGRATGRAGCALCLSLRPAACPLAEADLANEPGVRHASIDRSRGARPASGQRVSRGGRRGRPRRAIPKRLVSPVRVVRGRTMLQALARALSAALVLALLAATAAAFAITEGAKLQPSPLRSTKVTKVFSPAARVSRIDGHRYGTKVAVVHFKLRSAETVEAWIENAHGDRIRTLLDATAWAKGHVFNLVWDGFTDDGMQAPDGVYQPVVKLDRSHRTFGLPNRIVLDTVPPRVAVTKVPHAIISPDGDGHGDV